MQTRAQLVVLLVGVPGSGKSTFAHKLTPAGGWAWVNQDTLGDRQACEAAVKQALRSGKSVIVDRCNFNKQQRSTWVRLAYEHGEAARRRQGGGGGGGGRHAQQPQGEGDCSQEPDDVFQPVVVAVEFRVPFEECKRRALARTDHPTLNGQASQEVRRDANAQARRRTFQPMPTLPIRVSQAYLLRD